MQASELSIVDGVAATIGVECRYGSVVGGDPSSGDVRQASLQSPRPIDVSRLTDWAMGAALLLTLAVYMLLGNYARYVADDYGEAVAVRLRGYWAQQIADYSRSDGHFVATASYTAAALLGQTFVRILPAILLVAWVALLTLALRHLIPAAGRRGRVLIAAGIVYTTLRVTPNPFLALYWMTASLEFIVPLLLAAVVVWLMSRPKGAHRTWIIAFIALLAFLASGEAEIYTVASSAALTLTLAVALPGFSATWRQKLPELAAAWVGSLAGLAVELAAPGKAVRSEAIARIVHVPRPSGLALPGFTFGQMLHFLGALVQTHWWELLVMGTLAALIGARSAPPSKVVGTAGVVALILGTFGAVVIVFCAMTPAALYYGGSPPVWDQVIPVYVCVCAVAVLGWLCGRSFLALADVTSHHAGWPEPVRGLSIAGASVILSAAVVIGPIATVAAISRELPAIQTYAETKDAQASGAEAARAAGETSATVPRLPAVDNLGVFSHPVYEDLMRDPHFWINEDEAAYYGLESLATFP